MGGWISVSERLPEGFCLVVVKACDFSSSECFHVADYSGPVAVVGGKFYFDQPEVTHWQPLPEWSK
jgi:hypothetical protein